MPDQPLPTLAEIAGSHTDEARIEREEARALEESGYISQARKRNARAAWHEAAARQIETMAGQGLEVDDAEIARRADSDSFRRVLRPGESSHCDCRECRNLRRRMVRAALAAPPAEEPRECRET